MKKAYYLPLLILLGVVLLFIFKDSLFGADSLMSFNLYDADGNKLSISPFSVVNGVGGVSFIDFTISVINTGDKPLSCNVVSSSPSQFTSAFTFSSLSIPAGNSASWTSNMIPVAQFESPNPTVFTATVQCTADGETLPQKTGEISLSITSEGEAGFDVEIDQGTQESSCGDGTCDYGETASNCPSDCSVTPPSACFETNAQGGYSGYAQGTWIKVDSNGDGVSEEFDYSSTITAGSCGGTALSCTTTEGYGLHKYTGSSGTSIYICNPSGAGYKRYN